MRRRDFIAGLGVVVAPPIVVRAQQQAMPVIGYADGETIAMAEATFLPSLRRGLAANGLVEGKNFRFEFREAKRQYDRYPVLFRELADQNVTVIAVATTLQLEAARAATQSIPIIFDIGTDPVENGFVASLSRPGGNLTGVFNLASTTTGKRVEVLRELVPSLTKFAFLNNPKAERLSKVEAAAAQDTANLFRLELLVVNASDVGELEAAFETSVREGAGGMVVGSNGLFYGLAKQTAALAIRYRLPVIHVWDAAVREGVLVSYGTDREESQRLTGDCVARVLRGEKPADIPIQQAIRTKMVINLKTAKEMGITVPTVLLGRADEVIE
jgi:putative tryptophan/tyrosine transport system substrate-binding protein